jgi:hypothetical protein
MTESDGEEMMEEKVERREWKKSKRGKFLRNMHVGNSPVVSHVQQSATQHTLPSKPRSLLHIY